MTFKSHMSRTVAKNTKSLILLIDLQSRYVEFLYYSLAWSILEYGSVMGVARYFS